MKNHTKLLLRMLFTLIGTALVLMGSSSMLLGLAGERATAVVTSVRQEGGETDGGVDWRVKYSFYLPDGREIGGSAKLTEAVGENSTISVRYFTGLPWLSVPEENTGIRSSQFIFIAVGVGFIWLFNSGKKQKEPVRRQKAK